MAENKSGLRTRALSLAIPLWLAAIAVGEYMLLNHEKTPGTPAAAPAAFQPDALTWQNKGFSRPPRLVS